MCELTRDTTGARVCPVSPSFLVVNHFSITVADIPSTSPSSLFHGCVTLTGNYANSGALETVSSLEFFWEFFWNFFEELCTTSHCTAGNCIICMWCILMITTGKRSDTSPSLPEGQKWNHAQWFLPVRWTLQYLPYRYKPLKNGGRFVRKYHPEFGVIFSVRMGHIIHKLGDCSDPQQKSISPWVGDQVGAPTYRDPHLSPLK